MKKIFLISAISVLYLCASGQPGMAVKASPTKDSGVWG
jgi:hypothetical protein